MIKRTEVMQMRLSVKEKRKIENLRVLLNHKSMTDLLLSALTFYVDDKTNVYLGEEFLTNRGSTTKIIK